MRRIVVAVLLGAVGGSLLTFALLSLGERGVGDGVPSERVAPPSEERRPALGPDEAEIGSIRVTVETGTVNGAGTDNPVVIWFDNQGHKLSDEPARAFVPGSRVSATLSGSGVPKTLGELRRTSIVITLQLNRAEIAASWYCERARIEVRLEGQEGYATYLESGSVGWLSQDEPPRRSPAYALQ